MSTKPVFDRIIRIQRLREQGGNTQSLIETHLAESLAEFFPNAVDSTRLAHLVQEGFAEVPGGIPRQGWFDTNPPNWLMPSWSKRVQAEKLERHEAEIRAVLTRLRSLETDPESRAEAHTEIQVQSGRNSREREV